MTIVSVTLRPPCRCPSGRGPNMAYKFVRNTFPNNARMKDRTDLNPGEVFYISVAYPRFLTYSLLNGYDFNF